MREGENDQYALGKIKKEHVKHIEKIKAIFFFLVMAHYIQRSSFYEFYFQTFQ